MYYAIGVSAPSLHRESTDSLIIVSLIVMLREFPCFHDFSHMVHPITTSQFGMIFALVPHNFV